MQMVIDLRKGRVDFTVNTDRWRRKEVKVDDKNGVLRVRRESEVERGTER